MAKTREKLKALTMRREGISIKTIARMLKVSTGSVSLWCQSIELTHAQKEKLRLAQIKAGHKGRMLGAEHNRQKRLQSI
ncbi:MAG: helix-turn-helix domain-containing protein, partial [Patescibacteria group bacterium]|nr:helix-turn-helix domain-containing protein [Patescibacteria group bacterium]